MNDRIKDARRQSNAFVAVLLLIFLSTPGGGQGTAPGDRPDPIETGLIERAGVDLMLLDVVVTDRKGNPIPGLKPEDFFIQLNGSAHPIYSLDDLCSADESSELAALAGSDEKRDTDPALEEPAETGGTRPATVVAPVPDQMRFVIYLDFSQLGTDGRTHAVDEAQRWVRETMQPVDEVQVIAYATLSGLKSLTGFTRDKQVLLEAIDATDEDRSLLDPWPMGLPLRRHCCLQGTCTQTTCLNFARDEYFHGRRSLRALKRLLGQLEGVPGRKSLLMFHQNGTLFPARLYPVPEDKVPDQVMLLDEVGAEATLARTSIHGAYTGDSLSPIAGLFIPVGANLADFTGGSYSRGGVDLARTTDAAGRGSDCVYRIGLRRPRGGGSGPYRVKITAGNRAVPFRYRVQFLDEIDRWWRQAQDVLSHPEDATDVAVAVAVVPRSASDKTWNVSVQVALDLDSLVLFPFGGGQRGDWEVGAFLTRDEGGENWEMLAVSRVLLDELGPGRVVLHERRMPRLDPGRYRLAAFVRDRGSNVFGAAEATLELPKPERSGIAGPILMLAERERVVTPLPLLQERGASSSRQWKIELGNVPGGARTIRRGEKLDLLTWICPGASSPAPEKLIRFVANTEEPLFRFGPAEPKKVGPCYRITDPIETAALEPGSYQYRLSWLQTGGSNDGETHEREIGFRILAAVSSCFGHVGLIDGAGIGVQLRLPKTAYDPRI